ncbi:hypothetical protein U9R89_21915 [Pectobacterium brasiliense]
MPLTETELKQLQVLVTPAGWLAHQALPELNRIDAELTYGVYGDLRLVAADMLDAACLAARQVAAVAPGKRRIKVGKIEVESAAVGSVDATRAEAWCALAARLRVQATGSGVPGPALTSWGDPCDYDC